MAPFHHSQAGRIQTRLVVIALRSRKLKAADGRCAELPSLGSAAWAQPHAAADCLDHNHS